MLSDWVKLQKSLLDLERESEVAQLQDKISSLGAKECQTAGLSILNLEVDGTRSALFGRCCIVLQKVDKKQIESTFKVGDEVNLYNPKLATTSESADNGTVFGLISKVSNFKIEMVVEEFDENCFDAPLRLDLRSNQKTHSKMVEALSMLETSDHPLISMVFSPKDQSLDYKAVVQKGALEKVFNNGLNESQINAIQCSLGSPVVSLIHGPPGTGKTSTLTELILQAVQRDMKVLVCAPSNIAVDTILARLADVNAAATINSGTGAKTKKSSIANSSSNGNGNYVRKLNMVRIGHPARISANILQYALDSLIESDEGTEIVQDVRKEIDDLRKNMSSKGRKKGAAMDYNLRREQRSELRSLCKEAKKREKTVVERILSRSNVVLSTCIGASSKLLSQCEFDLVVIDEAAQGLEAACWVPILLGKKCVLAGDHCQLPPTIKSDAAEKGGLSVTLFERIINDARFSPVVKLLNVQYRMNDLISRWASREMYDGLIQSDSSVANHTLSDITGHQDNDEDGFPVMLLIDTSGCGMVEELCSENGSHRNIHEADIVCRHIQALLKAGVSANQIGVITPYNGQLEVLRRLILPVESETALTTATAATAVTSDNLLSMAGVEIKTIDGFQGGEKECIIMSLVRSNDNRTVGFLRDKRRINVGVTRAKRHLAIVCDSDTCSTNPFIRTLIDHIVTDGEQQSAYEYLDSVDATIAVSTVRAKTSQQNKENNGKDTQQTVFKTPAAGLESKSSQSRPSKESKPPSAELDFTSFFTQWMKSQGSGGKVMITNENVLDLSRVADDATDQDLIDRLVFPATLNSFQRMSCHEAAERLHLFHRSQGEGEDRFIEVSRVAFPVDVVTATVKALLNASSSHTAKKNKKKSSTAVIPPSSVSALADDSSDSDSDSGPDFGDKPLKSKKAEKDTVKSSPPLLPVEESKGMQDIRELLSMDRNARNVRVGAAAKESANSKMQSEHMTQVKQKLKKQANGKSNSECITAQNDEDDDAILNAAILENQRIANLHQYRVTGKAMPNPERESNKKKLHDKLAEAQTARKPAAKEDSATTGDSKSNSSSSSRTKVLKKPTPNFGGGKLGTK